MLNLMKFRVLLAAVLALALSSIAAHAQENGPWRASSSNAHAITGDIGFTPLKFIINFNSYTIAQIRPITKEQALALFNPDDTTGAGNIYRVDIPGDKRFLHHNTLCGSEDTQYIVTYAKGRDLQVAFFSGDSIPTLTVDALNNAPNLCGVFSYMR